MNLTNRLRNYPLARPCLFFIAGILAAKYFATDLQIIWATAALLLIVIHLISHRYRLRLPAGFLTVSLFFIAGFSNFTLTNNSSSATNLIEKDLVVRIRKPGKMSASWVKYEADVLTGRSETILLYLKRQDHLPISGDQLLIRGDVTRIPESGFLSTFDYRSYLAGHNIFRQVYLRRDQWVLVSHQKSGNFQNILNHIKNYVDSVLETNIENKKNLAILKSLLTGDKSELDQSVKDDFAETGTIHVLAISGLHLGIIFLLLSRIALLFRSVKIRRILKPVIVITGLWMFAALTGFSSSVSRSALMFSLMSIAESLNRKNVSLNTLFLSCLILLIIDPFRIFEVGFQFSFLAVAGILIFYNGIRRFFPTKGFLRSSISDLLAVSLCAQLMLMPLTLLYFHQFPVYFLPANLIVVPCITVVMFSSTALLLFSFSPFLSKVLSEIINSYLFVTRQSVDLLQHLPFSVIDGIWLNSINMFILSSLTLTVLIIIISKNSLMILWVQRLALVIFSILLLNEISSKDQNQIIQISSHRTKNYLIIKGNQGLLLKSDSAISDDQIAHLKSEFYLRQLTDTLVPANSEINFRHQFHSDSGWK
ncbi:MAG: DUF4131 domain-containing protein [Bacteroidetes bacterium]|nr:DUF4131 domain-containing protein [Bacteroidota bacterium]